MLEKDQTLHQKREVALEQKHKKESGEIVSDKPVDKVADWLKVLEKTHLGHGERDPQVLERIKNYYHKLYILPYQEEITKGAAKVEGKAAKEMGFGELHYEGQAFLQRQEIAVKDLEMSLDQWIDYLTDSNEPYPMWFRYYVFINVVKMGSYDVDKKEFRKRGKDTFFPFPDIDRGALGHVQSLIRCSKDEAFLESFRACQIKGAADNMPEELLMTKEKAIAFANKSFADQYAEAIKSNGEITPEMRAETRGEWKHFDRWSDPDELWASLQNKGVPWCTRGYATAGAQLQSGDFYVYYTLDRQGTPSIPRVAIRMDGNKIGEVRGVADNNQNLEGNMTEIAERKIDQLPGSDKYRKASADMKRLTMIENLTRKGVEIDLDDLKFLYEINQQIDGFGYGGKDPRIEEIKKTRWNVRVLDYSKIYEVEPECIAVSVGEINQNTIICIDDAPVEIEDLVYKTRGRIRILHGNITINVDDDLERLELGVLSNIQRMGRDGRFVECLVSRMTEHHETDLLGESTLRKLGVSANVHTTEENENSRKRIVLAVNYVRETGNMVDLAVLTHKLFADHDKTYYNMSESDYCYINLDSDIFEAVIADIETGKSAESVSNLFEFFMYSEKISEKDGIRIINTLMSLPEKALELLVDRFPQNSSRSNNETRNRYLTVDLLQKISQYPELLMFVIKNREIPTIKGFIENNVSRIKEIADVYNIELPSIIT
ncbi:MAG: hypothetical protein UW42_C0011G0002 [Candidatus Collierbacteria bacterium GW2011_GWB1_44_197]|nr:MAG: hypothetical protein UW42_C0011G0002 [Candidatus Collierbacteria bacterium GW2011_GWB1_44_197]